MFPTLDIFVRIMSIIENLFKQVFRFMDYFSAHFILFVLAAIVILFIVFLMAITRPKRQQRKYQKQTKKIYRKAANKQQRQLHRDFSDLARTCYQIVQMLNERISVEHNANNLIDVRDQYNRLYEQLRSNRPLDQTPEQLMDYYLRTNNDTSSRLYGQMQSLNQQYWDIVNRWQNN